MLIACLRFTGLCFRYLTNLLLATAVLFLIVIAGLTLTLRYWVLPDIGRYHSDISTMASKVVGQPVIIGKIEAGWRGIRPHLMFTDVRVLDKQGQTALALQRVDAVVSWSRSLLTGEVRLYSLEFDQPDLLIKRDAQGVLHIAGVEVPSQASGLSANNSLVNWLLHQARIVVRDARITWQDELRGAPPLVLNQVNLFIKNDGVFSESIESIVNIGNRHRFALRAQPPAELSAL